MNPLKIFRTVYKFRKWLWNGIVGLLLIIAGIAVLVYRAEIRTAQFVTALILSGTGIILCYLCLRKILLALLKINNNGLTNVPTSMLDIGKKIYIRSRLKEGPNVAVIGGGTGISTLLRGLKQFTANISAIITVADDGGGSGMLRRDLGMLPPGDIRNCILALADTEPQMEKLLQYRFQEGDLKGQSFGNLFLAAMTGISESFEAAVRNMSEVLAVTGRVLPVTSENINLIAELEDGAVIQGESKIGEHHTFHPGRIKRVYLDKNNVKPLESTLEALDEAEIIVLGPGSLYTSIIPNLLVDHVVERIVKSNAIKIYVSNIMTQPGETEGYTVSDHIDAIYRHSGCEGFIDYCIVNTGRIPDEIYRRYVKEGASIVKLDAGKVRKMGIKVVERDLVQINKGYVRHDPVKLAKAVLDIYENKAGKA
ncbi:YvcK family protein [Thermoclostridium stercorarium]|uniref:gluconeogenesis factor YvcK family protein n=1 Tax=Thermoclostridium stercorarium TaxID=1510 RepID=UPI00224984D6|nr:YvcK family protein [Thermoclostridium stercorarium]UZQ84404.1 YvcK family protein [Thermoclostridium stercorarium]